MSADDLTLWRTADGVTGCVEHTQAQAILLLSPEPGAPAPRFTESASSMKLLSGLPAETELASCKMELQSSETLPGPAVTHL